MTINVLEDFQTDETAGRRKKMFLDEDRCYMAQNNPFWVDQNFKIALSKAYRRMEGKTQVFYSPETPYARTRMTHTMEVKSLASIIARNLDLNHHLAEAIALGHDIGHVPFGHLGESFLTDKLGESFRHNAFAVIVAEFIEREGSGLNLSYETLEGIYRHSGNLKKFNYSYPQEYFAARIADKVAYIFSDYNDAQRMGYVQKEDKPNPVEKLGDSQRERVKNVLKSIFLESESKGMLSFKDTDVAKSFMEAYEWMFENVYYEADKRIDMDMLERGFQYIQESPFFNSIDPVIAFGLSTEKEIKLFSSLWEMDDLNPKKIEDTGVVEVIPCIENINIKNFHDFPFSKEEFKKAP